jgi:hypothetical protein
MRNTCFLLRTSRPVRCVADFHRFRYRTDTLDLDSCYAFTIHFRNRKTPAPVFESLATLGNESQLSENESSYRGISRVFWE